MTEPMTPSTEHKHRSREACAVIIIIIVGVLLLLLLLLIIITIIMQESREIPAELVHSWDSVRPQEGFLQQELVAAGANCMHCSV